MIFLFDHDVPDELGHFLRQIGHEVRLLRKELPTETPDADVLAHASQRGWLLVTCNRDDFLELASKHPHAAMIVFIRRRTRVAERAALLRLLQRAGADGLTRNINLERIQQNYSRLVWGVADWGYEENHLLGFAGTDSGRL